MFKDNIAVLSQEIDANHKIEGLFLLCRPSINCSILILEYTTMEKRIGEHRRSVILSYFCDKYAISMSRLISQYKLCHIKTNQ